MKKKHDHVEPKRTRLLNVAQVRVVDRRCGMSYDFRCDAVEVTTTPAHAVVVLYSMFTRGEDYAWRHEPLLVGRIAIDGAATLVDPAAGGDAQSWCLKTDKVEINIRPYAEDAIWVDRAFGSTRVKGDADLERLHTELRGARFSLICNERLARSTPPSSEELRNLHGSIVKITMTAIEKLERQIAAREGRPE